RALKLNPGLAGIWVQYGHALKEGGKLDEAGAAYAKAIAIAPMTADTHLQMGHLLKLQGRADDAAASYLRAVALDPELRFAVDEHTSELQSRENLVCRLLLEKKKKNYAYP